MQNQVFIRVWVKYLRFNLALIIYRLKIVKQTAIENKE